MFGSSLVYSYDLHMWHMELLNTGGKLMLLVVPFTINIFYKITNYKTRNIKQSVTSNFIVHSGDSYSKSPSRSLLAMESVASGLLDIELAMDVCFFFIVKENIELWVPATMES